MSWHHAVLIDWTNEKNHCPTAANQLRNVCHHKRRYFCHYEVNTWTYMFFSFSRNTKKKLVCSIKTWTWLCKNWSLAIKTVTAGYQTKTLNLHTANQNLFNNGHFAYNYERKCKNNVVLMKSNYLNCPMQHHISIKTVKRYMTQIDNSLAAPCWHHVWRERGRKALWINMDMLCAKIPQSQNRRLSPGSAIFQSLRTDKL